MQPKPATPSPEEDLTVPFNWVTYLRRGAKFLTIFYITTFCLITFFLHHGVNWLVPGITIIMLYIFIFIISTAQLVRKLPLPVLFLASPTIPLFMLICILTMLPLLA